MRRPRHSTKLLGCLAVLAPETTSECGEGSFPTAARNGRRRGELGKGWRRGKKGQHKADRRTRAHLDAFNAKRREQRLLAREARAAAGTVIRKLKSNGAETPGNGTTVSPAALWKHARKLEPRQPWRAVARASLVSATGPLKSLTAT
jgi:hypothetical protein